ncbi:hypothetical protein HK105_201036 [Polyrhizophydium stewartii]|uniref:Hcy-binding domain-containing protein n=1 Tax=Polyrhizophydium stewartii TaxID=2732419 RepID=A0ABR4NIQ1_9FUNG
MLAAQPGAVHAVHAAFFRCGAHVATACTYQASPAGFAAAGFSAADAARLPVAERTLAAAARAELAAAAAAPPHAAPRLVAASLGSYGALLANGAEFTGDFGPASLADVRASHLERLAALLPAALPDADLATLPGARIVRPDVVMFETIPSLLEAQAIASLISDHLPPAAASLPFWVSFSCRDGASVCHGEAIEACVDALAALPAIAAVGVNCTAPHHVAELVRRIRAQLDARGRHDVRVLCYPNSGEIWDAEKRTWSSADDPEGHMAEWTSMVRDWVDAARLKMNVVARLLSFPMHRFPLWTFPPNPEPVGIGTLTAVGLPATAALRSDSGQSGPAETAHEEAAARDLSSLAALEVPSDSDSDSDSGSSSDSDQQRPVLLTPDGRRAGASPASQRPSHSRGRQRARRGRRLEQSESAFLFQSEPTSNHMLQSLSRVFKSHPSTTIIDRPPSPVTAETRIGNMLAYYEANYFDSQVPNDLLLEHLKEHVHAERSLRRFDLLAGNRLHSWIDKRPSQHQWIAYPGGSTFNRLCMSRLQTVAGAIHTLNGTRKPMVSIPFDTPILQIASSMCAASDMSRSWPATQDFLAVRSYQGLHILRLDHEGVGGLAPQIVFGVGLSPHALDVCFSPSIPGHAAIAQERGGILIWDARFEGHTSWRSPSPKTDQGLYGAEDRTRWTSCRFGAHPRTLCVAGANDIQLCDLRMPSSAPQMTVFDTVSNPAERIMSMDRNPESLFEIAVATTERCAVFDARFSREPLLQWALGEKRETQMSLSFVPSLCGSLGYRSRVKSTSFMTWGRHLGEVMMYTYNHQDGCPPVSTAVQRLAHFSTHPHVATPPLASMRYLDLDWSTTHAQRLFEREVISPDWPALAGCEVIPNRRLDGGVTVMHLALDGAIYAQAYAPRDAPASVFAPAHPETVKRELDALDAAVFRAEIDIMANIELPKDTFKSHDHVDMRQTAKLLNDWVGDLADADAEEDEPDFELRKMLPNSMRGKSMLWAGEFKLDEASRRKALPRLCVSERTARRFPKRLARSVAKLHAGYPEMRVIEPGALFAPWNTHDAESGLAASGSLSALKDSLRQVLNCDPKHDTARVGASSDASSNPEAAGMCRPHKRLYLSSQLGLDALARDLQVSRFTVIPFASRTLPDPSRAPPESAQPTDTDGETAISDGVFDVDSGADEAKLTKRVSASMRINYHGSHVGDHASVDEKSHRIKLEMLAESTVADPRGEDRPSRTVLQPVTAAGRKLKRTLDGRRPIEAAPAILHAPFIPEPAQLSATAATFADVWNNPDDYYDPGATSTRHIKRTVVFSKRRRAGRTAVPGLSSTQVSEGADSLDALAALRDGLWASQATTVSASQAAPTVISRRSDVGGASQSSAPGRRASDMRGGASQTPVRAVSTPSPSSASASQRQLADATPRASEFGSQPAGRASLGSRAGATTPRASLSGGGPGAAAGGKAKKQRTKGF